MTVKVTRVITMYYDTMERYLEDKTHWSMQDGASGNFGPFKVWHHEVTSVEFNTPTEDISLERSR